MNQVEYENFTRAHQRFVRQVLLDLEFFQADIGLVGVFSIESRIKTFESASIKARKMKLAIDELQDVAGIRIVVATRPEVDIVKRFFQRRADIEKDLEIIKEEPISRASGYRSTHLVTRFSGQYARSSQPGNLEVQIPTIFEHAFNFISRSWVYKSSTMHSPEWRDEFVRLSTDLSAVDDVAGRLHRAAIDARIDPESEPLTPLLFQRLARDHFQESVRIEDAVDYCQWYTHLGVSKVSELARFFADSEVQALWDEFAQCEARIGKDLPGHKSKVLFWGMFGTRREAARKYLASAKTEEGKSAG
jgi:ppGpp synthetase/RelA/SpoT-type nucleotidyltranferase